MQTVRQPECRRSSGKHERNFVVPFRPSFPYEDSKQRTSQGSSWNSWPWMSWPINMGFGIDWASQVNLESGGQLLRLTSPILGVLAEDFIFTVCLLIWAWWNITIPYGFPRFRVRNFGALALYGLGSRHNFLFFCHAEIALNYLPKWRQHRWTQPSLFFWIYRYE